MTDPLRWQTKAMLAKIETSYGVDPTPTAAMLFKNVVCRPMEGQDVSRDIERPFFGAQEEFVVGTRVGLEFDVELVGGGTAGTAPPISPLLRACRLAETIVAVTSVTYTPIMASMESCALYYWIGGNRQKVLGCRGNVSVNLAAQQIPTFHFNMMGLYAEPAATALPALDFSAFKTPLVASNVNTPIMTVGGVSLVTKSYSFDAGNDVQPRFLIGRHEVMIVDGVPSIEAEVEAVALATFNPFDKAANQTTSKVAIVCQQDTRAGYKVAVSTPTTAMRRLQEYRNDQNVLMWPLRGAPIPTVAGGDDFSIAFT